MAPQLLKNLGNLAYITNVLLTADISGVLKEAILQGKVFTEFKFVTAFLKERNHLGSKTTANVRR
jgi:hypothetical protein